VGDDWRVTATFGDPDDARKAVRAVRKHHVDEGVRSLLGGSVAVSSDGPAVLLYAGTKDAAREAERAVREVLVQHQIPADQFMPDWWDPDDQEWHDASIPLPHSDDEQAAEHQDLADDDEALMDDEFGAPAAEQPQWEVRAELPSHHQAVEVARRLQAEGHPVVRRWRYLIVGAASEDEAGVLAQEIAQQAQVNAAVMSDASPFAHFEVHQPGTGGASYLRIS
jgi:hypothetical protein